MVVTISCADTNTQRGSVERKVKSVGQDELEEEMEEGKVRYYKFSFIVFSFKETIRLRSNTMSAASLRPSSYGHQHPSIQQADSLPMGRIITALYPVLSTISPGYRVVSTRFRSLASRPVSVPRYALALSYHPTLSYP